MEHLERYAMAAEADPVGGTWKIQVIKNGNENCMWGKEVVQNSDGTEELQDIKLHNLQLLQDCETCWSSTHLMVDCLIELYAAVQTFLVFRKESKMQNLQLSQTEFQVINDIWQILLIPHRTQELLSAEKMPTISTTLPAYEVLVEVWQRLCLQLWELSHYIGVGISKINEYVQAGCKSHIYALAIIINPTSKMTWIKEHWLASDTNCVQEWMIEACCGLATLKSLRNLQRRTVTLPTLATTQNSSLSTPNMPNLMRSATTPHLTHQCSPSEAEKIATEDEQTDRLRSVVEQEFDRYLADGTDKSVDIVQYWDVLQVLKYVYKHKWLNFCSDWVAREEDYAIDGNVTEYVLHEMMSNNRIDELRDLLHSLHTTTRV
ncbi:hypothetical protein PAXRUDRAFT_35370 [Paxillus rubicundulus Ve08.2h10]|uniref:Uncharacterized protein n=1 Tax=Paxillus rubicundulus Ve08.2h10 TaxID=930991 RepID=A0A0D0CVA0_9AGAM|nr:hypothetical protein PAXRUDRAFT_35370 [Paxillus rubicundulus Ve08.2h10]